MKDKKIICQDCDKLFVFSIKDQKFYEKMGFGTPIRCKECREKRKQDIEFRNKMFDYFKKNTIKIKRG